MGFYQWQNYTSISCNLPTAQWQRDLAFHSHQHKNTERWEAINSRKITRNKTSSQAVPSCVPPIHMQCTSHRSRSLPNRNPHHLLPWASGKAKRASLKVLMRTLPGEFPPSNNDSCFTLPFLHLISLLCKNKSTQAVLQAIVCYSWYMAELLNHWLSHVTFNLHLTYLIMSTLVKALLCITGKLTPITYIEMFEIISSETPTCERRLLHQLTPSVEKSELVSLAGS